MEIKITISDEDVDALEHDLLDVKEWVRKAVEGKIAKCRKRLIQQGYPDLLKDPDVTSLPATEDELVRVIQSRPGYQKRKDRNPQAPK